MNLLSITDNTDNLDSCSLAALINEREAEISGFFPFFCWWAVRGEERVEVQRAVNW